MGVRLLKLFLANSGLLSNHAFRIGVYMAFHTKDRDSDSVKAGEYAKGADMAMRLLYPNLSRQSGRELYARAVSELVSAGIAERAGRNGGHYQRVLILPVGAVDKARQQGCGYVDNEAGEV